MQIMLRSLKKWNQFNTIPLPKYELEKMFI